MALDEKTVNFAKAIDNMIAVSENAYIAKTRINRSKEAVRSYTKEEVEQIINGSNLDEQVTLSRNFFEANGLYRRIILYYATLLKHVGITIPNPTYGNRLSTDHIKKRYFNAVEYMDSLKIKSISTEINLRVLIDGCYYGILKTFNKKTLTLMTLPAKYCVTRYKTPEGDNLIEFDVTYFDSIKDEEARKAALLSYPKEIAKAYRKYKNGKLASKWVFVDSKIALCFSFFENPTPLFLSIIPSLMDYDESVEIEKERDLEEIKKIIVQKVPHLNDGSLLFEPDEVEVMHRGAVKMLQANKNVSVLTTYTDVDAIVSKSLNDTQSNNLEKMVKNVYVQTGTSQELFASTSNLTLIYSIKNDIALMMVLADKLGNFFTSVLNHLFSNANVNFKYKFLPVSIYTEKDYVDEVFKLAQSGYSLLIPSIAMDISQKELSSLKELENDVLELEEVLRPLSSSWTQSSSGDGAGRPKKEASEMSPKTEANQKAIDNQGQGGDTE